ncbi:Cruciform DNA binding protein [Entomophthora muscae]|uniref:Cruciform DNA binding protein n=1 Tax=Entomophthora muscae TaxID=34485 RepID=A0ACC2SGR2_9FUNG|nr:Cruciform DNA binding protein [Entomophthora muscae]
MSENNSYENLPLVQYTFSWPSGPSHVSLCGQFDLEGIPNWSEMPLEWQDNVNCFQLTLLLSGPKHVDFKFVVEGVWVCHPHLETRPDSCGFINNYIFVEPTAQAVESKPSTPETLVESQPEEAKWCESPLDTNENNSSESICEYKEPEKMVAEEKATLILPTEAQDCTEKHPNLDLNLNTLDAFDYQFMGLQDQDSDSFDSSSSSHSSSEESINLSQKGKSCDSLNIHCEETETVDQPQCSEHTTEESHLMVYEDLNVNSLVSQETDTQDADESETNDQPQCSEHITEESPFMVYEDLNVNSLVSQEKDTQDAGKSETNDQPQCSEHTTYESPSMVYEDLNVNSLTSQETDTQYAAELTENNEECETEGHSDSDGEPEEPENNEALEDTKSSQETQEKDTACESDAASDEAVNQAQNEVLADDDAAFPETKTAEPVSPNSPQVHEQVEFTRSQFYEEHMEDDESKPSIPMVLCSLTLSYIFYGLLAVSTIAAKKSVTIISSKVLDVIQNHSEEAVKMTEHTASEVHELNIFEILMGLTLVASGMIVAFVLSSFKSRT